MSASNLLVELRVEELPPKALWRLGQAFAKSVHEGLVQQRLVDAPPAHRHEPAYKAYATPRRLAVWVQQVQANAKDQQVVQKLMPKSVGLDANGQPTQALMKKWGALGLAEKDWPEALAHMQTQSDGKNEVLTLTTQVKGVTLAQGLQIVLDKALADLPIPKVMQYPLHQHCDQPGWRTVSFVRPAHGLVALHGDQVVDVMCLGWPAGRLTQGHRFEAKHNPVSVPHADAYENTLAEDGAVMVGFEQRCTQMLRDLRQQAKQLGCRLDIEPAGLSDEEAMQALPDHPLVQEVTALVERPTVMLCQFDPAFLQVPKECLTLTMKANQKYFPLLEANGNLSHRFLIVSNINPADPSAVISGNERVVRPRLADAQFFFNQDRKKSLDERVAGLDKVVYHSQLGTQGERAQRVSTIAKSITLALGPRKEWAHAAQASEIQSHVVRAARLAKTDLLTDMVGEFPELQGVMGRYYALHDGEHPSVCDAIAEHYQPRFAGDSLPQGPVSVILALADKLETLVGLFGIGQLPTGDKDPYALRRHALGVARLLIEHRWPIGLHEVLSLAREAFAANTLKSLDMEGLQAFIQDRLAHQLEAAGHPSTHVMAVLGLASLPDWSRVMPRLEAVSRFIVLPESEALAAANKRITNILKKTDQAIAPQCTEALLLEPAERALHDQLTHMAPQAQALLAQGDEAAYLRLLAQLRDAVDRFFNEVMVNVEDPKVRQNRLGLLKMLQNLMNQVADLSRLAT